MTKLRCFKTSNMGLLGRLILLAGLFGLGSSLMGGSPASLAQVRTMSDSGLVYMPGIDGEPVEAVVAQTGCLTCRHGYQGRSSAPMPIRVRGGRSRIELTSGPLPHAREIQANLAVGLAAGKGMCARAVWRILLKSRLVRGSWYHSGADAKDMGRILAANGFRNDRRVCNRPGVVRIYGGNASGHRFKNRMLGDSRGHIEILGLDRRYHSFYSSAQSISQSMKRRYGYASRRPLIQCWYKP